MLRTTCRIGSLALALLLCASCSGITEDKTDDSDTPATSMILEPAALTLDASDTAVVKAKYMKDDGNEAFMDPALTWTSSDPTIVTVQAKGLNYDGHLTAITPGTATITAVSQASASGFQGSLQKSVVVTVRPTDWILQAVTDATSQTWLNNSSPGVVVTGTGTLSNAFPQTLHSGTTVTLRSTFLGSIVWTGPSPAPIILTVQVFAVGVGFIAGPVSQGIGTPTPAVSGSVSASGSYVVPASGHVFDAPDKLEFIIQPYVNLFNFGFPNVKLTYTRTRH